MNEETISPGLVNAYQQILENPVKNGFDFKSIKEYFQPCEEVTAKHILAESYIKYLDKPLKKVILYIIMDNVFGQAQFKDSKGNLGYKLKIA